MVVLSLIWIWVTEPLLGLILSVIKWSTASKPLSFATNVLEIRFIWEPLGVTDVTETPALVSHNCIT